MTTLAREIAQIAVARVLGKGAQAFSTDKDCYHDDIAAWLEREFIVAELNAPLILEPYQRAVLREACRRAPDGKFIYDLVLWSDIKKSNKSTIAAGVVLYRALHTAWGSFKIVANDLRQANSRVFEYIRRAIELNPSLKRQAEIRNYKITLANHAVIEAVPIDPSGEAGGNDDMISFTELHGVSSAASMRMWSELTIPPNKHGFGQRWIDTYAGHSGEAPILEMLYAECVQPEKRISLPDVPPELEVYASGSKLCLWNTAPRCPWQTPAYYASEASTLIPAEFDRIHRNAWSSSLQKFVPDAWWEACKQPLPALDQYRELAVGIDAGVSDDCFGIVAVSRQDDMAVVRYVEKWQSTRGEKLDFREAEATLRRLAEEYNVIIFEYDPYQLHDLCFRLAEENIGYFKEFNQGAPRLVADKQLYDMIKARRVLHSGDSDLTAHIQNANAKSDGESKLRLVKRAEHLKIDLAVALSMAVAGAMEYLTP